MFADKRHRGKKAVKPIVTVESGSSSHQDGCEESPCDVVFVDNGDSRPLLEILLPWNMILILFSRQYSLL